MRKVILSAYLPNNLYKALMCSNELLATFFYGTIKEVGNKFDVTIEQRLTIEPKEHIVIPKEILIKKMRLNSREEATAYIEEVAKCFGIKPNVKNWR